MIGLLSKWLSKIMLDSCRKLVKTNLSLMKAIKCRLSNFSKGRQGGYEVGSVDKGNMLKVVRDGARYVNVRE